MESIDFSKCKTNKDVSKLIIDRVRSVSVEKLVEDLSVKFVQHESTTKTIYAALASGENSILFGPGGFGKSELVKSIIKYYNIPVIYKVGYPGMTSEELFGIPNIKKLLEESKFETAFENSVFSKPGILVLEEIFDADAEITSSLKDILSEKGMRESSKFKESLISSVILVGNKSPEDVSINDSIKAFFLERFPFRKEVIWSSFNMENYLEYFTVFFDSDVFNKNKDVLELLAKICCNSDSLVSPRLASKAANTVIQLGLDFLPTINGIDSQLISDSIADFNIKSNIKKEKLFLEDMMSKIKSIDNSGFNSTRKFLMMMCFEENFMFDSQVSDHNIIKMSELSNLIKEYKFKYKSEFENEFIDEISKL
jgi:hypothetical protein